MKNSKAFSVFIVAILCCFSYSTSFGQIKAQKPTKEEVKFWKKKAKGYVKQPMVLKQELDNYQKQVNELKTNMAQLQAEYAATTDASNGLQGLIDSLKWENVQLKAEKQNVEKKLSKMEVALKGEKKAAEQGTKLGLVYRTQIGAYVTHEMQGTPQKSEDFLHEKTDGFNKYLVGNFRTQPEAEAFANEIKILGIKDAFAVPYIDGVRVTFAEANTYLSKQSPAVAQPAPAAPAAENK